MSKVTTLGIDLAKSSFQLHGVDKEGRAVLKKKLTRKKLSAFIHNLEPCLIGMEACGGAHYWARVFKKMGHEVKIISPQFVKPYVKSNKNDANDAEAICEAVQRPNMRFVPMKKIEQQDIQALHRVRSRLVKEKTALINSIRGILLEYGVSIPQGLCALKKSLVELFDTSELSGVGLQLFHDLYEELLYKEDQVKKYDLKIQEICNSNKTCQRLLTIPGVGVQTASILYALLDDGANFKNGREFSSYLGLVPKQSSTGGRSRLLGISKRGDSYARGLLIHGARSVILNAHKKPDVRSKWVCELKESKGVNKTTVALANRNARVAWALVRKKENYKILEQAA